MVTSSADASSWGSDPDDECTRYLHDAAVRRSPDALLAHLRERGSVQRASEGSWLVTDYDAAFAALRDERLSRAAAAARFADSHLGPGPERDLFLSRVVNTDGPPHTRLRALVSRSFTPAAVQRVVSFVESTVGRLLDSVERRHEADIVHALAKPLAEQVICHVVGLTPEEYATVGREIEETSKRAIGDAGAPSADPDRSPSSEVVSRLVAEHRATQRDDLLSQLIGIVDQGVDYFGDYELVSMVIELVGAGSDTTAALVTNALLTLLREPSLYARLVADPSLAAPAVEETLRLRSPVQLSLGRVATEEVTIADATIPAGCPVTIGLAAANRAPRVFDDPGTFRLDRADNPHVSFGFGTHYCLGASLARTEATIALRETARRLPALRLVVDPEALEWRRDELVVAPAVLPVAW
jgi:cytochrome P450